MYAEANINRLMRPICGRVLCWTNSKIIEFLNRDLTQSVPLYSRGSYSAGQGLAFSVELDGFLTFDKGSFVKVMEVAPFKSVYFDPAAAAPVSIGDVFPSKILSVVYATVEPNGNKLVAQVNLKADVTGQLWSQTYMLTPSLPTAQADALIAAKFPAGTYINPDVLVYLPDLKYFQS